MGAPLLMNNFWDKIKNNNKIEQELKNLVDKFNSSESSKLVSKYWEVLNIKNLNQIANLGGIENYSNTVARNYYYFDGINEENIYRTLQNVEKKRLGSNVQIFKKHPFLKYVGSYFYNTILLLLYENLKLTKSFSYLEKLKDDAYLGFNDPYLEIENVKVTHDKVNSLLDYDKISKSIKFEKINNIVEIGAGSGRTSEVILTLNKNINYIICDIPPAIYISYKRLKKAFPKKKINLIVDTEDQNEIKNEIENNDISFIFPHQLNFMENFKIDLTLAIDCIHEMDNKVIKYYFDKIGKISNFFYFSVWKKTTVPFSENLQGSKQELSFDNNDYNIPDNWENIFKEDLIFPCDMICSCYKVNNKIV